MTSKMRPTLLNDFLIMYVHLLLFPMPAPVAIVMGAVLATMKLELAVYLGSNSGSLARLGSGFDPQVLLSKPQTRQLKLFVLLKPVAALQFLYWELHGPLVSDLVQHTPFLLLSEQCYRSLSAMHAWQSRASHVHRLLVSKEASSDWAETAMLALKNATATAKSSWDYFILEI